MRPSTSDDAREVARAKIDGVLVGICGTQRASNALRCQVTVERTLFCIQARWRCGFAPIALLSKAMGIRRGTEKRISAITAFVARPPER